MKKANHFDKHLQGWNQDAKHSDSVQFVAFSMLP